MIPYSTIWAIEDGAFHNISNLIANLYNYDEKAFMGLMQAQAGKVMTVNGDTATINIKGPLVKDDDFFALMAGGTTYASIESAANQASQNDKIKNVILSVDSPGGTVDGVTRATKALSNLRSTKSVVGFVDGMAASAGLWALVAGAETIMGTDTSRMGSIGVKSRLVDVSAKLEKEGIVVHNIASGSLKAGADFGSKISEETIAEAQKHVDEYSNMFIKAVADGRGFGMEETKAMATGALFTHSESREKGLMDSTGTRADVMDEFAKLNIDERLQALRS
jgi:signal peptide peptidase SppA